MLVKRLYIVFILFSFKATAQINLVPNYSFEDTLNCPTNANQLYNALGWINPSSSSGSTPDYFNSCSSLVSVPLGGIGFQYARTGVAYAGFYGFQQPYPNEYEYVEAMLSDSLKQDSIYCVSFYLSLSNLSGYSVKDIGVYFSNSLTTTATNIILATPQLVNSTLILSDTSQWMKLEWQYTALGGERYITIGNFNNTSSIDTMIAGGAIQGAYYLIDDVYVGECPNNNSTINISIPNIFTPNNDNVNDLFKIISTNLSFLNCKIYNRWGILVGELKDVNDSWDGRNTAGIECVDGVYYYILTAKGIDNKEYNKKGFVQLIK